MYVWDCVSLPNNNQHQIFQISASGSYKVFEPYITHNQCMSVRDNSYEVGAAINHAYCNSTYWQRWYYANET
jgi:hypothetical protein